MGPPALRTIFKCLRSQHTLNVTSFCIVCLFFDISRHFVEILRAPEGLAFSSWRCHPPYIGRRSIGTEPLSIGRTTI
jgi:hypothetical protein